MSLDRTFFLDRKNLHQLHQPLHSEKMTVWCAMTTFGLADPYYFEDEGTAVCMKAQH